jgi:hypothetical protein
MLWNLLEVLFHWVPCCLEGIWVQNIYNNKLYANRNEMTNDEKNNNNNYNNNIIATAEANEKILMQVL